MWQLTAPARIGQAFFMEVLHSVTTHYILIFYIKKLKIHLDIRFTTCYNLQLCACILDKNV